MSHLQATAALYFKAGKATHRAFSIVCYIFDPPVGFHRNNNDWEFYDVHDSHGNEYTVMLVPKNKIRTVRETLAGDGFPITDGHPPDLVGVDIASLMDNACVINSGPVSKITHDSLQGALQNAGFATIEEWIDAYWSKDLRPTPEGARDSMLYLINEDEPLLSVLSPRFWNGITLAPQN